MRIYIPTYGRHSKQITFNSLPEELQRLVVFVVKPEEADLPWPAETLVVDADGVAAARQAAVDHSDHPYVCMLDDDLRFSVRDTHWQHNVGGMRKATHADLIVAYQWMFDALSRCPMVGLAGRGGNHGIKRRGENPNFRIMRSFAVDKRVLEAENVRFDRLYYWEDFDVCVTLLERGYPNVVNIEITSDGITDAQGGINRNRERMSAVADEFQRLHPWSDHIIRKEKEYGPDFTIRWKRIFGIAATKANEGES